MKYSERKQFMADLNPEQLKLGKGWSASEAEGHFRYYLLMLLADLCDSQDNVAYQSKELLKCYQEMLALQKSRTNGPGVKKDINNAPMGKPKADAPVHPLAPLPSTPPSESRYGVPREGGVK